jgi:hypothetical protein
MPFRVREGMDVGVRSSNDIYDPIGQVGWLHWVFHKIVDERWSPYSQQIIANKTAIPYEQVQAIIVDLGH